MTVAKTHNRKDYVAGAPPNNKTYAFDFKIYDEIDLLVYVNGGTPKVLNTDYTISGGPTWTESGGNVVFVNSLVAGDAVLIYRELTVTQGTAWPEGDPFPSASHENAADRLVMLAQQFKEAIGRVFKVIVTSLLTDIEVPEGAGKLWGWNAAGDGAALYNQIIDTGVITTKGDFVIGGDSGIPERKAIGNEGDLARVASGIPDWEAPASFKLDDWGAPDDNTDLDATVSKHGLFPKFIDDTTFDVSTSKHGFVPKAPNDIAKTLKGNAAWAYERVVQIVNYQTGAVATGTTIMPIDDTIPQITEGNEYMTLAITPKSATNKLRIDIVWNGASSISGSIGMALFRDAITDALAACFSSTFSGASQPQQMQLTHYMTSPGTGTYTFRVRVGAVGAGTTTFNGISAGGIFGGVMASSITITEIAP